MSTNIEMIAAEASIHASIASGAARTPDEHRTAASATAAAASWCADAASEALHEGRESDAREWMKQIDLSSRASTQHRIIAERDSR